MKTAPKLLFVAFLLAMVNCAKAQFSYSDVSTTFTDAGEIKAGSANSHYSDLDGNPYMFKGWLPGSAWLSNGKYYTKLVMMYDEVEGMPVFKNSGSDSAMTFSPRAIEFEMSLVNASNGGQLALHFKSGFEPADGLDNNAYYQVLETGEMNLLKRSVKTIVKHTAYPANEVTRTLEATDSYYLAIGHKPVKVKNNNKAVLAAMGSKAAQVKTYIDNKNLNVKSDNDFIAVVKYYNTL